MSARLSAAAAALADLAHTLESAQHPRGRIQRAIEQVRLLLASDACAFVSAGPRLAPALVVVPVLEEGEVERLEREGRALLALVAEGAAPSASLRERGARPRLAVPLVAVGQVAGVVLVERTGDDYEDEELQLLAVAASQLGAYLAALDARERERETARALAAALGAAREVDERKVHFLNVLSHELRNPLAPMRTAVEVLAHAAPDAPAAQRARDVLGRQLEHLARLLGDLLDAARVSTGKVHLARARLDLAEVVRRTVEDHRAVLGEGAVELALRVSGAPLWVDGDATRLAQVVGNLLANARKFTSAGGHVEVSVARQAPAAAVVRVRDDGVGIAPGMLPRLFEEFAQGDESLDRGHAGLGLGLALAKALVELHGGTIAARSDGPGRGAEFVVTLPLATGAGAGAPPRRAAARAGVAAPRRILVIDDNRDAAESLRDLLQLEGHSVEVALDGPAGLALARSASPEVVLCDIGLPGMNGYDVARALRLLPELSRTVLVAVTGYGTEDDLRRAQEAGFDRHLVKPVALESLEAVLGAAGARGVLPLPEPLRTSP